MHDKDKRDIINALKEHITTMQESGFKTDSKLFYSILNEQKSLKTNFEDHKEDDKQSFTNVGNEIQALRKELKVIINFFIDENGQIKKGWKRIFRISEGLSFTGGLILGLLGFVSLLVGTLYGIMKLFKS